MASRIKTGEQWLELVNDGNVPLVKALAKKFNGIMDENGNTALILAVKKDQLKMIPILAPLEARKKDVDGYTALMHAVKAGNVKACELLASAEYMDTLEDGCNALMLSLEREMLDVTQIFLPYFDLSPDSNGLTPIDYAIYNKNYEGIRLLLNKYNPAPETLQQSLKSAQDQGHQEAITILTTHCSTYQPNPVPDEVSDSKSDTGSLRGSKKLKVKSIKPAKPSKKDKAKGSNVSSMNSSMVESTDDHTPACANLDANELILPLDNDLAASSEFLYVNRIPTPTYEECCMDNVPMAFTRMRQGLAEVTTTPSTVNVTQLHQRIAELEAENTRLKDENARLKDENARLKAGMNTNLSGSIISSSHLQDQVVELVNKLSHTNERLIETIAMSESLTNAPGL
ncbi:Protein 21.1 [Giardia lamblia P15]|uniref:Protein 21.1 n=1 Tax=Giardia intestinalis (strain P15) TaxID=658858 RepID=E1EWD0_GIAIA|nr:Protein 21.1 [Giardia lamblia P15]